MVPKKKKKKKKPYIFLLKNVRLNARMKMV